MQRTLQQTEAGGRQGSQEGGGASSCCREDVAAASAVANCASKSPKGESFAGNNSILCCSCAGEKAAECEGGRKKWQGQGQGQPGVTSIIVKCSEAFGQLQHQQRTLSLAPCPICSRVFPESKLPSTPFLATPLSAAAPPPPTAAVCPACPSVCLSLSLVLRLAFSSPFYLHSVCFGIFILFLYIFWPRHATHTFLNFVLATYYLPR